MTDDDSELHHIPLLDSNDAIISISSSAPPAAFLVPSNGSAEDTNVQLNDRNASPSRASKHSAASNITSASVPPLKRKIAQKHMRYLPHSVQSLAPSPADDSAISSTSVSETQHAKHSQFLIGRANTAPAPSPKRPPASHSSYGVGTTVGPPPSFDTRRTTSQERVWRFDRLKSLRMTVGSERLEAHQGQEPPSQQQQQSSSLLSASSSLPNKHPQSASQPSDLATPPLVHSSPETADTPSITTPTDGEEVAVMDVRSEQGLSVRNSEVESKTSSESHKSEDLFLNIARDRPISSRGDRRRPGASLPFLAGARPASSHQSPAMSGQNDSPVPTPRAEVPAYQSKRSSLQFGQLRGHDIASDLTLTDAPSSEHYTNRDTLRPAQRSSTIYRGNRLVSESGYVDRPKYGEQNATESTTSTTAPSTVWDELDDLKSRIRKLELTGKLPPSSAAAMSSAERPRTATTAATTLSSSPKHNKISTPLQSTFEGVSPNVHPLLHEALGNAKAVVSPDVYQKLQATAQDALQLASLTSFDGSNVRSGAQSATERQIRRKTESMCRSLTELAIALSAETKTAPSSYRPPSRDHSLATSGPPRSRRYSQNNDNTDRPPVSARIQSRLETRRTSAQYGYANARQTSPEVESPTALPQYPGAGNRITRVSGGLRNRRVQGFDGANDEGEASPSVRPVSRAMTDVAVTRRASRDHAALSREYTLQHAMPTNTDITSTTRTPLPANLSTNFISRRKNVSPGTASETADSSPLAPRQIWGRVSIVQQKNPPPSDTTSEAPAASRSVSARRSLGFASRLGSSVGNRLRATKTERIESRSYRESPLPPLPVDPASIVQT